MCYIYMYIYRYTYHTMSCHITYHIISCHVMSRHVMLYVCDVFRVFDFLGLTPILFGWCFSRVILLFWQSEARLFQSVESVGLQGIGFPHLSWRRWADELFATDGLLYNGRDWRFRGKWWPAQVALWSFGRRWKCDSFDALRSQWETSGIFWSLWETLVIVLTWWLWWYQNRRGGRGWWPRGSI
jgi:hypothetical protein